MNPRDLFDRLDAGYKYDSMYGELCNERDKLKAENAKLRETVKAAWGCVNSPIGCHECRMVSGGCTLLSAMRELGMELGK